MTTLLRVRSRARACSRPETPILPTRFHEEPEKFEYQQSYAYTQASCNQPIIHQMGGNLENMHEGRKQAIEHLMDLQNLTFEQASKLVDKQNRVDQIRSEAESILGQKLPPSFSSKFIEEFYVEAPKIAVWIQQAYLSDEDSPQDWRFMNDLNFEVQENLGSEWFSVRVSHPSDNRSTAIIHVIGSPAQVLADFVKELSESSEDLTVSQFKLPDEEEENQEEMDRLTITLAIGVSRLPCRVETTAELDLESAVGCEGQSLSEALKQEGVVPNRVPTKEAVSGAFRENEGPLSEAQFEEARRTLMHQAHREFLYVALRAGEDLLGTLGEGRSTSPVVSPRELFNSLQNDSTLELPVSKRQVAVAYFEDQAARYHVDRSAATHVHEFIDEVLEELGELIKKIEFRLPRWDPHSHSHPKKTDEDSLVFYQYVKGAIEENREFLVRLNAN